MKDALPTLKEQFLALSPNPEAPGSTMVEDGGSTFLTYASGRRGVMSLHSTIDLVRGALMGERTCVSATRADSSSSTHTDQVCLDPPVIGPAAPRPLQIPRQDPLSFIYRTFLYPLWDVKAEAPSDTLTLSLALLPPGSTVANSKSYSLHIPGPPADKGDGLPTGVWAVLQKAGMDRVRKSRWDLSFPRVIADGQSGVDRELAVLAEHADVTKAVLGSGTGLRELLTDAEGRKYLKNFIVHLPSLRISSVAEFADGRGSPLPASDLRHPDRSAGQDTPFPLAAHAHAHARPPAAGPPDDGLPAHAPQHGRCPPPSSLWPRRQVGGRLIVAAG